MKLRYLAVVITSILCLATVTSAQRTLEKTEALEILENLAERGVTTWLPAGTIEATHQEYRAARITDSAQVDAAIQQAVQGYQTKTDRIERTEELQKLHLDAIPFNVRYGLANESTMDSSVVVKYDGNKFYWEIDVTSRTDSVKLSPELEGNYMADRFDVTTSGERVFVWDGQEYTIHSVSANHAIVDAANRLPRTVNGPLTAGIIPWGQGALSSETLSSADISAVEILRDGTTQIEMMIEQANGLSIACVLDPAKDYAATYYTFNGSGNKAISRYYSGYRQMTGHWVPTSILIEQHDLLTGRLLRSDKWDLTVVDGSVPGPEQFDANYRADTVIEYHSTLSTKASIYNYSNAANTNRLLAEHLTYAATKSRRQQNCATAAVKHAATQLGKSVPDNKLASLIDTDGQTTMEDLKRFAKGLGLHCRAVHTDLATLRGLPGCQAILHIPGKNHYVVLDRIDERDAWIIDLSNPTFYYRKDKDSLPLDWSEGTALLLSARPIAGSFAEIDSGVLSTLSAGDGWSCTRLLQEQHVEPCTLVDYDCWGDFLWYYERWGCEAAPSGSCPGLMLARYAKDECYWDFERDACASDGNWKVQYMYACD